MQGVASALGGYLTGRLRTWVGIRTDEIFFLDTAHGFLAWALATGLMAALFSYLGTVTAATGADATMIAEAAEQARKIAGSFALFTSLSFFVGAFIASTAVALGGFHRDEGIVFPLPMKPLETLSDKELRWDTSESEVGDRKAAIAAEILRRHKQARVEELKRSGWFGGMIASLVLVFWGLNRLWPKS